MSRLLDSTSVTRVPISNLKISYLCHRQCPFGWQIVGTRKMKKTAEDLKLSEKRLVLFAVNDNDDLNGGESVSHWSMMAYDRSLNAFVHHDSMEGVNNINAVKLFDVLKAFMGSAEASSTKTICQWYSSKHKAKEDNRFSALNEQVTASLELKMRTKVLKLIEELEANS
ncbi:hypothetical protein Vadar_013481 [Vaccinium darrowii]|uniref:Uncharacterized protein n=1 Tax=Vaccinium darrowii TaxID=229202 RepID=A0ACB7ZBG1_9ERIC|nr:hypothetical protein Vadar_013481 [Vaccinium darrowii]